ncbi:U-box domain-containing protein 35 [Lathyrus oleraceus]|uniref:Uncharacterized protein n=1 Tax=Pisum sativum TaxID=3888 RepID=A0A9D4X6J2_PEA|nr:U-box domain-containing protein 35-like [Pisum sativum]KAI5414422.1 hypothetical protein KIW84_040069 [Pisum sativum]
MSDECLQYHDDDESSRYGCGLIGFKKNQVFDYNLNSEIEVNDDLFEINLKKEEPLESIKEEFENSTVSSLDIHNNKLGDVVYVAVRIDDEGSSMEALSWALKHSVIPSITTISLLHVFPQIKQIPSPLGKIPRSRVNQEHVDIYLAQEKSKRRMLLQKFIDLCTDSKVKVEVLLIESDNFVKAIVDLVININIMKLVIGIPSSNLRKHRSSRKHSIADMVLKSVEEKCDVRIICEGREMIDQMINGCTSSQHDDVYGFVRVKRFMSNPFWLFRFKYTSL